MSEKKLEKKVRKLAKWAKKNGFSYASIFAIAPKNECERWYASGSFAVAGGKPSTVSCFYTDEEVANG